MAADPGQVPVAAASIGRQGAHGLTAAARRRHAPHLSRHVRREWPLSPKDFRVLGSDDGLHFWTLHGEWTGEAGSASASLVVDVAPIGGPRNLPGVWFGDRIAWQDGNEWTVSAPPCAVRALAAGAAAAAHESQQPGTELLALKEPIADARCWQGKV